MDKKINIKLTSKQYDIIIKKGCVQELSKYIDINRKILVITDEHIPSKWSKIVCDQLTNSKLIKVPQGESAKSFRIFEEVLKKCLEHDMDRKSLIIALGGGVIGDLSGFVAGSYMRGIEFISIPTTTLSMVDSSIGGKVAINLDKVKNIVGTFYHPSLVLVDTDILSTLDSRNFMNGMIEALKSGLIHDPVLFELFEQDYKNNIEEIIYRSLMVKKKVVEEDEKELGIRKTLNFGHTIGHGIESYYDLKDYLHGECVAMGMLYFITEENLKNRVLELYNKLGITSHVDFDIDKVYDIICHDKKSHEDMITVCKVGEIGKAYLEDIKKTDIYKMLANRL